MTDCDDVVLGRGGDDTIYISPGSDFYDGGTGTNSLNARYFDRDINIDLDQGTINPNNSESSTFRNIQNYSGNSRNDYRDIVRGTNGNNTIRTFGGNDTVYISQGNDYYDGGDGHDTLNASEYGRDRPIHIDFNQGKIFPNRRYETSFTGFEGYEGRREGNQRDYVVTGDGYNEIRTYNGDDRITISGGNDYYLAGDGIDTLSARGFNGNVVVDLNWRTVTTDLGNNITAIDFENYEGNFERRASDYVRGNTLRNVIKTFEGEDIVYLSKGNDEYDGGQGVDILDAKSRSPQLGQARSMFFNMDDGFYSWNDGREQHTGKAINFEIY